MVFNCVAVSTDLPDRVRAWRVGPTACLILGWVCGVLGPETLLAAGMPQDSVVSSTTASPAPNRSSTGARLELGKSLFEGNCVLCHGIGGTGGRGPGLNRARLARAADDAALRSVIANGIPPGMPSSAFTDEQLAAVVSYVRSLGGKPTAQAPGDVTRGAEIFKRSGCSGCHIVAGKGSGYGPELTDLGQRRSAAYVRETILNPGARLPEDFLLVAVTTARGERLEGIRVNEDVYSIQLKDAAGRFYSLRKSDLKALSRLKGKTPMPSFGGVLTSVEVQDVVAYLEQPLQQQPNESHAEFSQRLQLAVAELLNRGTAD